MKMNTMSESQLVRMHDSSVVSAADVGKAASLSAPGALGLRVHIMQGQATQPVPMALMCDRSVSVLERQ